MAAKLSVDIVYFDLIKANIMDNHNGNNGPTVPASVRVTKTTPDSVNRIVGVILLVIMIGVFWIYGF